MIGGIRQALIGALTSSDRPDRGELTDKIWVFVAGALRLPAAATAGADCSPRDQKDRIAMADPHEFHTPKSFYTKDDLLLSGQGGYFGPGNAQLPAPPMLMMDRITEISLDGGDFGKGHVVAELDITPGPLVLRLPLSRATR